MMKINFLFIYIYMVLTKKNNLRKKIGKTKNRKTKMRKVKSKKKSNRKQVNKKVKNRTYKKRGGNFPGKNFEEKDLRGANFKNVDLRGANLKRADLRGVKGLTGKDLQGANFAGANLLGANLSYSNLSNANFEGANLTNAKLKYTCCMRTNFRSTTLNNVNFEKATFDIDTQFASLLDNFAHGAIIEGADFKNAVIYYGNAKHVFKGINAYLVKDIDNKEPIMVNDNVLHYMKLNEIKPIDDYLIERYYPEDRILLEKTKALYNKKKIKNLYTVKITINPDDIPYNTLNEGYGRRGQPIPLRSLNQTSVEENNKLDNQRTNDIKQQRKDDAKKGVLKYLTYYSPFNRFSKKDTNIVDSDDEEEQK
jgi:uncharacterized protein YjbI with pentapeptide repeats